MLEIDRDSSVISSRETSKGKLTPSSSNPFIAMEYDLNSSAYTKTKVKKTRLIICTTLFCVVLFLSGFLIGYFATSKKSSSKSGVTDGTEEENDFHLKFQELIDPQILRENLRYFSSKVHIAGSKRQEELADYLVTKWRDFGFDTVKKIPYDVYLSSAQESRPNTISLIDGGKVVYNIAGKIKIFSDPTSDDAGEYYYPFNGFSPAGTVEGGLVYVNYGTDEDYKHLAKHNISVKGKIVLARQPYLISIAEKYGAVGFISFPNVPAVAPEGTGPNDTYPNKPWMSKDAINPALLFTNSFVGDPLTPGLPATRGIYRTPLNISKSYTPTIPTQPISYGQAWELLKRLNGPTAPSSWLAVFKANFSVGPGFQNSSTAKVRLEVNTRTNITTAYNVIGTITGREEPDRYVIIGNHRDAMVNGAVDALSGTTTTHEIARVLGELRKLGWRPRRTIKICSWGAEEWGLYGSTEWVEQDSKVLGERAVAYINLDMAVSGNFVIRARASPLFKNATLHWTKRIQDPSIQGNTIYDTWLARTPSVFFPGEPMLFNLFHSSDYVAFYDYLGIPSSDYGYWYGHNNQSRMYPVYHSSEDTFYWMKTFGDPGFKAHNAMTQFSGGLVLDVADSPLLPYSISDYAVMLNFSYYKVLHSNLFFGTDIVETHMKYLKEAILAFTKSAKAFDKEKDSLRGSANPMKLRVANDQMVQVEKAFIAPVGLPGKQYDRHVAFNFGFKNVEYVQATFPGVTEQAYRAVISKDWSETRRQLSMVINAVQMATKVIEKVTVP